MRIFFLKSAAIIVVMVATNAADWSCEQKL
jgi:hypothetical protein